MSKTQISNTAVIYFSLTPGVQARKKSFVSGGEFSKNFRIAGFLRHHTKRQIEQTDLPFFLYDERNQRGETFGEKIVSAVEAVFKKGFNHVVVVGDDTPRLQSDHLLGAANELQNGLSDIVLGPAGDGGTWLMGFSQRSFDAGIIKNLAWNTGKLLTSIFDELGNSHLISLLDTFDDLDSDEDLQKFLCGPHSHNSLFRLKRNIQGVLDSCPVEFFPNQTSLRSTVQSFNFLLRGPPSASDLSPLN